MCKGTRSPPRAAWASMKRCSSAKTPGRIDVPEAESDGISPLYLSYRFAERRRRARASRAQSHEGERKEGGDVRHGLQEIMRDARLALEKDLEGVEQREDR